MSSDLHDPAFIIIGRISKPHGVHGEMKVAVLTDQPERFGWLEQVYLSRREQNTPQPYTIESVRFAKTHVLLKLEGIDDRGAAGALRSHLVRIPTAEAIPLQEGEFFLFQLLGMTVVTDTGETLGKVSDIIQTGANDVFVVNGGPVGEILLPDTDEVVLNIDGGERQITVHLIDGLLPE